MIMMIVTRLTILDILSPVLNMWTYICKCFRINWITVHAIPRRGLNLQFVVFDLLQHINHDVIVNLKPVLLLQQLLFANDLLRMIDLDSLKKVRNALFYLEWLV